MKRFVGLIVLASLFAPVFGHADTACGDEGLTCGDQERCCEHLVAFFSDASSAPPYVSGTCVASEQKCSEFWCGNEQCKAGIFTRPSVCCISLPDGASSREYTCKSSELNCPGNTQRLTIRDTQPTRTLRRG